MTRIGGWLVLALIAVGAFLAGRASNTPDIGKLRDTLVVLRSDVADYERAREADAKANDSLQRVIDAKDSFLRLAEAEGHRWRLAAARNQGVANRHGFRADSLELAGDTAAACLERKLECAALRKTNADLVRAGQADAMAKDTLRGKVLDYVARVERDSVRLFEADTLLSRSQRLLTEFEKAAGGCRVPLAGIPCPEALVLYSFDDRALRIGATFPVKLFGFRVNAGGATKP
jgi:hypothetical protein